MRGKKPIDQGKRLGVVENRAKGPVLVNDGTVAGSGSLKTLAYVVFNELT